METPEKQMNEQESLQVIYQMINSTKQNLKEHSLSFLFWGYLVLGTVILQYFLINIGYENNGIVWAILMPLGGIVSGIMGYKQEKKVKVKTHLDDIMRNLGIGFGVSFFVLFFVLGRYQYTVLIPHLIAMLYGFFLIVMGGILKFKPLIFGAVCCWICAIAACYVPNEALGIIIGLAVITGYIIPGHMLRAAHFNN